MELYQIGAITATHGVKGEVKVFPMTDDIKRFKGAKGVILKAPHEEIKLDIVSARAQKNLVIVKFAGIDNINDIEKYKGCGLFVTEENRVKLSKDEYFASDLMGMDVITDEGEALGEIIDVLFTGANDVYVVKTSDKDVLIPAIKDVIKAVDVENRKMTVHLLDGLLDI